MYKEELIRQIKRTVHYQNATLQEMDNRICSEAEVLLLLERCEKLTALCLDQAEVIENLRSQHTPRDIRGYHTLSISV